MTPARLLPLLLFLLLLGCREEPRDSFQGYVEGEYLYLAAPAGGDVVELAVREGDAVEAGQLLYRLDPEPEALRVVEAERRVDQARARLADLRKGARPSEVLALEERIAAARSGLEIARRNLERREQLGDDGSRAVSEEEVDQARTQVEERTAEVARLEAELDTLRLGGREDAVQAAEQDVAALEASLEQARWLLEQKRGLAPAAGRVQDTLYRTGEFVPAGRPVLSLLPPENRKVRFFVPQAALPTLAVDQVVRVRADGLEGEVTARIRFLSSEVEYTPPVIFSQESREKLMVRVEAWPTPEDARRLRVGQPVEVRVDGPGPRAAGAGPDRDR